MNEQEMIKVIRKKYKEIAEALHKVEEEYNLHRRNHRKRADFEFILAQEMVLSDLCGELGIELRDE